MAQLTPIKLDNGSVIYIEATEDVETTSVSDEEPAEEEEEEQLTTRSISASKQQQKAIQNFQALQGTISTYTNYTLSAFKAVTAAKISKVTLEFGIKIGGEAAIPYVTKGTAESNLKITVECEFGESETTVTSD